MLNIGATALVRGIGRDQRATLLIVLVGSFFVLMGCYVAARYGMVIANGGSAWTTGDWLIHYDHGFVRRGITGAFTLWVSDLTGFGVVWVAGMTQIAVYAAYLGLVMACFLTVRLTVPVLLLLFSPAFLMYSFYYLQTGLRKEIVAHLAVAMIAAAAIGVRRTGMRRGLNMPLLYGGLVTFLIAGLSHEANTFLALIPVAFLAMYQYAGLISRRLMVWGSGAMLIGSAVVLLAAATWKGIGIAQPICDDLVARGVDPIYCQAAIGWLEHGTVFAIEFMWSEIIATGYWPHFILGYALALLPFLAFRRTDGGPNRPVMIAAALGLLALSPLFVVASDWGRWIVMYIFGLTLLTVTALRLQLIEPRWTRVRWSWSAVPVGFFWSIPASGEGLALGMLSKAARAFERVAEIAAGLL